MSSYTKLKRDIWRDADFVALPSLSKLLYVLLISQPSISSCGVLSLSIRRWATLLPDTDADSVRAAFDTLVTHEYLWVDEDTEEVAVRTYMVHDELWKQRQGWRSIEIAMSEVLSADLKTRVSTVAATLDPTRESTVDSTLDPTVEPLPKQQPLPNPQQQQQRDPGVKSAARIEPSPDDDKAAAAIEMFIRHKIRTEEVRSPERYANKLRPSLMAEHGTALYAELDNDPAVTPEGLCIRIFKLRTVDLAHVRTAA